jgi:hypothetical protein
MGFREDLERAGQLGSIELFGPLETVVDRVARQKREAQAGAVTKSSDLENVAVTKKPSSAAGPVTKNHDSVTEIAPSVTENQAEVGTAHLVLPKKRGRKPLSGVAMTAAEKQRAYRQRKKGKD